MNKRTTGLCLTALTLSCCMNSVLIADELVVRDNYFTADEVRHQWVNERNGRTGVLMVSGALLSSPCTLETNEVELPLQKRGEGMQERYPLKLNLVGCDDGNEVTSANSPAGREHTVVRQSVLLASLENGTAQLKQQSVARGIAVLYGGKNQFTYYLNKAQHKALTGLNIPSHNALLHLQLDYE